VNANKPSNIRIRQLRMRTADEIAAMRDRAEDDIRTKGWDPKVDAMSQVLAWVLDDSLPSSTLQSYLGTSVGERRSAWIATGGNPADWPLDDPESP
jgi:hypothetical protein